MKPMVFSLVLISLLFIPSSFAAFDECAFCTPGDEECIPGTCTMRYCYFDGSCSSWQYMTSIECCDEDDESGNVPEGPGTGCTPDCKGTEAICVGPVGDMNYFVSCMDYNDDGCYDWDFNFKDYEIPYCEFGCSYRKSGTNSAYCEEKPVPCTSKCSYGASKCSPDGNYVIPCLDDNGDGCYDWSNQWSSCQYGCEVDPYSLHSKAACSSKPDDVDSSGDLDNNTWCFLNMENATNSSLLYDASGNAHHFISVNNPGFGSYIKDSRYGSYSYNFTNASSVVYSNENTFPPQGTISFWLLYAYPPSSSSGSSYIFNTDVPLCDGDDYGMAIKVDHSTSSISVDVKNCRGTGSGTYRIGYVSGEYPDDGNWHFVKVTWDPDYMDLFVDGVHLDEDAMDENIRYLFMTYYYLGNSSAARSIFAVDDFKFSRIVEKGPGTSGGICDYEGQIRCRGTPYGSYSSICGYNSRGILDWIDSSYCLFGCDENTGECFGTSSNQNYCGSVTEFRCGGPNGEWEQQCFDDNGDGYLEWSRLNTRRCAHGCNPSTGRCYSGTNYCELGESVCCGALDFFLVEGGSSPMYPTQAPGYYPHLLQDSVCVCGDFDNDGYREYSQNGTVCQYGCSWDFDNTTDKHYAWCNANVDEVIAGRNFVEDVVYHFSVAFQGTAFRFFLSIMFVGIAFGAGTYYTKKKQFGIVSGLAILGICMYYGWIPVYLTLGAIGVSLYFIFRHFIGGGSE